MPEFCSGLQSLDVGAQGLKPLFIAECCVTTVFLDMAFAAERSLRHEGHLARNTETIEKALSVLSSMSNVSGRFWAVLSDSI